jgi:AcrR family transcriptional regulator
MNSVHTMKAATPRRERLREELRQEILDAARELFVKEGYEAVSMRKIADKVGCAAGTIYLHFEDKDSILNDLARETFQKLDRHMDALAQDHQSDPLERLRRGGRRYIDFGLAHPQHYLVAFFGQTHHQTQPTDAGALSAGLHSFDCLRQVVRQCVDAGRTASQEVEQISQVVWLNTHGVVMGLITMPQFPFIEQSRLIDASLDMCIEGIRKR